MIGHAPALRVVRFVRSGYEFARAEKLVDLGKALHLARRHALENVLRAQLIGMAEAGGTDKLAESGKRVVVEPGDALRLSFHHDRALAELVLGRHAARATVGVAGLGLHAAEDRK